MVVCLFENNMSRWRKCAFFEVCVKAVNEHDADFHTPVFNSIISPGQTKIQFGASLIVAARLTVNKYVNIIGTSLSCSPVSGVS